MTTTGRVESNYRQKRRVKDQVGKLLIDLISFWSVERGRERELKAEKTKGQVVIT